MKEPAAPNPNPNPEELLRALSARLVLIEAIVLHRIPAEERQVMYQQLKDALEDGDYFEAASHLETLEDVARILDRAWKHPNHQGA